LQSISEIQYEHFVSQLNQIIPENDECRLIVTDVFIDMENGSFEYESKEIRDKIMSLLSVKTAPTKDDQKEAILSLIEEEMNNLHIILEFLEKQYSKGEKQLKEIKCPVTTTPTYFLDQWITFEGHYLQFKDLNYQHDSLQHQHRHECNGLIHWYQNNMETLEAKYNTRIAYQGWSENEHFHFLKLKEEYKCQTNDRYALFCRRVEKEMPHIPAKDISNHYDWANQYQSYQTKKSALSQLFKQKTQQLIVNTIQGVVEEKELLKWEEERDICVQNRILDTQCRHSRLIEMRREKLIQMKQDEEERNTQTEIQLMLETERLEKERQRRIYSHNQIEKYHAELLQKRKKEEKLRQSIIDKELERKIQLAQVY
jgi:hypothetical protein